MLQDADVACHDGMSAKHCAFSDMIATVKAVPGVLQTPL